MKTGRGGVKYVDLRIGEGALAARGCEVRIRYDLMLNRGDKIQEEHNASFRIGDRSVIAGLEYGVEGMREGGVRRVRVGPRLAYRSAGVPGVVPHDAVLEFQIELLKVLPVHWSVNILGYFPGNPFTNFQAFSIHPLSCSSVFTPFARMKTKSGARTLLVKSWFMTSGSVDAWLRSSGPTWRIRPESTTVMNELPLSKNKRASIPSTERGFSVIPS